MAIFGIGMDLVEVSRIEESIVKHGEVFLRRVFSEDEQRYCMSMKRPAIHFAARFAAKEAVAKAFGTGIGKHAALMDIQVTRDQEGRPSILLTGAALAFAERNQLAKIHLSLTHTDLYAAAQVVIEIA